MNRSLYRRALAASLATFTEDYEGGGVEFAAVFPHGSLSCKPGCSCGGQDLAFELPDGSKPFAYGRWWKPDDWSRPLGSGVATVAIDRDEGPQVYTVPIGMEPCEGHENDGDVCAGQTIPSLYDLLDKPWRARWSKEATWTDDPTAWALATRDFEILEGALGFLPVMDEWIWNPWLYGSKWYLPLRWTPHTYREDGWEWMTRPADRDSGLRDVVRYLDGLREERGATIRVYPDRRVSAQTIRHTQPGDHGEDARYFLEGIERWKRTGVPRDGKTYVL